MKRGLNFVILRFDGINLALPSSDVLGVESFSSLSQKEIQAPAMGTLAWEDGELPVYMMSRELDFSHKLQQHRRFCACLAMPDASRRYALVCEAVEQYAMPDNTLVQMLPEFMRIRHTPIQSLFRLDDNLALVCTAESLGAHVAMLEAQYE